MTTLLMYSINKNKIINRCNYHELTMSYHKKKFHKIYNKNITNGTKPVYKVKYNWLTDMVKLMDNGITIYLHSFDKSRISIRIEKKYHNTKTSF